MEGITRTTEYFRHTGVGSEFERDKIHPPISFEEALNQFMERDILD